MTMDSREISLLITCEHGGNDVPFELQALFSSADARQHLGSHRGFDPGSLIAARKIADLLEAPLEFNTLSRLVVDFNRSLDSDQLFSKFVIDQEAGLRHQILQTYYHPYRQRVSQAVSRRVEAGQAVLHLSIHTFTPRFRGTSRNYDVGVLFDPQRSWEDSLCRGFLERLARCGLRVFPNQPYLGIDDGLTTALRTAFFDACYAGIELELNNRFAKLSENSQTQWCDQIAVAVQEALLDH